MKIYDSDHFCWCDLCGQIIVGGQAQVIESDGLVMRISDLQIAHQKCWAQTHNANGQT